MRYTVGIVLVTHEDFGCNIAGNVPFSNVNSEVSVFLRRVPPYHNQLEKLEAAKAA